MHRLTIRAVGKSQESWQQEAIDTYLTRLKPLAKVDIIEVHEGHQGATKPNEDKTRQQEAENLLRNVSSDQIVIAVDETGKNLSSIELAQGIESWSTNGQTLVFLLGGSWGLHQRIRDRAQFKLSLGKQTLPHILARLVLIEQLYRAEMILAGKTYHK